MQEATYVSEIRDKIRGEISCPGDEFFDIYRKVWNGMIDRRPSLIVRCAGAADVKHCILFARDHNLSVAVRSGGHSVPGYGVCDSGLVIDLSAMKGININKRRRSVDAQAGLTWREFDHETISFGLATTGGVISSTGIRVGWGARRTILPQRRSSPVARSNSNASKRTRSTAIGVDARLGISESFAMTLRIIR